MTRSAFLMLWFAFSLLAGGEFALAQGKGQGFNRGLGAAARGPSGAGIGRSTEAMSRAIGHVGLNLSAGATQSAGISRAAGQWERAAPRNLAKFPSLARRGTSGSTADRIYAHRLQQAEHLRGIAAQSGNESLLDTADRMELSAARNYERQAETAATVDSSWDEPLATDRVSAAHNSAHGEVTPPVKRGFWIRPR